MRPPSNIWLSFNIVIDVIGCAFSQVLREVGSDNHQMLHNTHYVAFNLFIFALLKEFRLHVAKVCTNAYAAPYRSYKQ